jgi:hypothetical protein
MIGLIVLVRHVMKNRQKRFFLLTTTLGSDVVDMRCWTMLKGFPLVSVSVGMHVHLCV